MPSPVDPESVFSQAVSEAVRNAAPGTTLLAEDLVRLGERASGPLPQPSRPLVIRILRKAEKANAGQVLVGRRGKPTRFVRDGAPVAAPRGTPSLPVVLAEVAQAGLEVPFSLASGRLCVLRLPSNLTADERAELRSRIGGYLGGPD